jgi:hypothetical protein
VYNASKLACDRMAIPIIKQACGELDSHLFSDKVAEFLKQAFLIIRIAPEH